MGVGVGVGVGIGVGEDVIFSSLPHPTAPMTSASNVTNAGEIEGTYTVTLKVEGKELESQEVTLAAGATQTVTFSLVEDRGGSYDVAVDGVVGTLLVEEGMLPTLHVGDQWVYREIKEGVAYTRTETITGGERMQGKNCYVVRVTYDPPSGGWIPEMTEWWEKGTLDLVRWQFSARCSEIGRKS